jgi:OFA family oxalate/formate antiporter-like MFS transporter
MKKIHYGWYIFISTCIFSLVGFGFIVDTIGLFFTPMGAAFHVGRASVSMMVTIQNFACAITLLFAGKIMQKVNIKLLLTTCFLIVGLGFIGCAFATNLTEYYVIWCLIGITQPFALTLSIPLLLGNWFQKYLGTVMGIALGLSAIGGTIFNPIISSVITNWGWRNGWLVEGLITLIAILPFTIFVIKYEPTNGLKPYGYVPSSKENKDSTVSNGLTLSEALRTPMFYLITISMIVLQWVAGLVQHVSPYVVSIHQPLTVGATVVSGIMMGAAVGKITIGWFLDHVENKLVIAGYTIVGIVGWWMLWLIHIPGVMIAAGFIAGLGQGIMLVSLPYFIRKQFGQKDYSNILSIISMFGNFATAIAVSVDGKIFDVTGSYNGPLFTQGILYIIGGVAVIMSIIFAAKRIKKATV